MTTENSLGQPSRGCYLEAYLYLQEYGRESADMIFKLQQDQVYADFFVLRLFCGELPFIMEGDKKVVRVPDGLQIEALQAFVKAIYLGKMDKVSFATLLQVRNLGVLCNCEDVQQQCDQFGPESGLTEDDCHLVLQELPMGSSSYQAVLEFMIRNLKSLVDNKKSVRWRAESWVAVLDSCQKHGQMPLILTKEELYEGIRKWRKFEDNANNHVGFVEICKVMGKNFLYEVVYPNSLLNESLMFQVIAYHDGQQLAKADNNNTFWTHSLREENVRPRHTSTPIPDAMVETSNHSSNGRRRKLTSNHPNYEASRDTENKKVALDTEAGPSSIVQPEVMESPTDTKENVLEQATPVLQIPLLQLVSHEPNDGVFIFDSHFPSTTPTPTTTTLGMKEASNFAELMAIFDTTQSGDHILLKEGTFVGQMKRRLPDRVTISGMGRGTIVTAAANDFVWDIVEGNHCVIENIHFKKEFRYPRQHTGTNKRRRGIWICGSQLTIRKCYFSHCCLEVAQSTGSTFKELVFESFYYGIVLAPDASKCTVSDVTFQGIKHGIDCWGHGNIMNDLKMINVDAGVVIQGDGHDQSGDGNVVSNVIYQFNPNEPSFPQVAVEIFACSNNKVENVECFDYAPILGFQQKRAGRKSLPKIDRLGLRIANHHKDGRLIAKNNVVKTFKGGPVKVFGEGNRFHDISDCALLEVNGTTQEFSNCHVDAFNLGVHANVIKGENCNF